MNSSTRVLHIVSSLGMGGAETWLIELSKYLSSPNAPFQFDFLITHGKKDVFDEIAEKLGCRLYYAKLNKSNIYKFIKNYRRILRENKYLAIHDHQDILSGWHFLFGLGLLPKVTISHFHNPSYQLYENYGATFSRKMNIKIGYFLIHLFSTHIAGTSMQLLKEHGITQKKYKKKYVGPLHCSFLIESWSLDYEISKRKILNEIGLTGYDKKIILFVGRLDYWIEEGHPKNHKNSVFAANIFRYLDKNRFILLMVGSTSEIKDDFEQYLRSQHIEKNVILMGIRHDIKTLMAGSDLLLFPSRAEGLGMVAVEAQASGLPVLASDTVPQECVVIEELVKFMSLKESHEKWALEIDNITKNPRPASNLNNNRWKNSKFNIKQSIKLLNQIYFDQIIKNEN